MAADPIIYCLEHLTDYDQFERLCTDVMAGIGYPTIEPLGGRSDQGRDALHISRTDSKATLFAYSVRDDWQRKLEQDCDRIQEKGHECQELMFVCTSTLTASEKDKAKARVHSKYGWVLHIYDLERLRVLLCGEQRHLVPQHPQIFSPPFFRVRGGLSTAFGRDTIVIDHVHTDRALALWLSRRLQLCGYATWCQGSAPLGGESPDETIRELIENRAARYLPLLSRAALDSPDLLNRCAAATRFEAITIPCDVSSYDRNRLGSKLGAVAAADFTTNWTSGLKALLSSLEAGAVKKVRGTTRGAEIALRACVPEPVTSPEPEVLYSNVFPVVQSPLSVLVFEGQQPRPDVIQAARSVWPFVALGEGRFAAFYPPPVDLRAWRLGRWSERLLSAYPRIEGRRTRDVVTELVRRSMELACYRAGLVWCSHRQVLYFPSLGQPGRSVRFTNLQGEITHVNVAGVRTWGYGDGAQKYHYQLSPDFRVGLDESGQAWATLRIYVRVTRADGEPFNGKAINSRRKKVTKSWWNQHWLARTLGVVQAIASEGKIVVGPPGKEVVVGTTPLSWDAPVSIDEDAVRRIGDFQEEMAATRYAEESEVLDG